MVDSRKSGIAFDIPLKHFAILCISDSYEVMEINEWDNTRNIYQHFTAALETGSKGMDGNKFQITYKAENNINISIYTK